MFGQGVDHLSAGLVAGQIYTPYHVATLFLAGLVVWSAPQTWDFTRQLTWPKAAAISVCFAVALVLLAATSFHPFIYFIF